METVRLSDVPLNISVKIAAVADFELSERIVELGFIKNAVIKPVHRSMRGGVTAYEVMGSVFALRRSDAEKMAVSLI